MSAERALLRVDDLRVAYHTRRGHVQAVDGVTFEVRPGEVTALVGESGSGKTTVAQAVIGLLAGNGRVTGGGIRLGDTELTGLSDRRMRDIRGRRIGLIPQDPGNSLNPVVTIGASIAESLRIHGWRDRAKIRARVLDLREPDEIVGSGAIRRQARAVPLAALPRHELDLACAPERRRNEVQRSVRVGDTERGEVDDLVLVQAAGLGLAELIDRPA